MAHAAGGYFSPLVSYCQASSSHWVRLLPQKELNRRVRKELTSQGASNLSNEVQRIQSCVNREESHLSNEPGS